MTPDQLPFHIAVFARAPRAGHAKTRLMPLLGAVGAAAAQRAMSLRTLQVAAAAAPGQVSLWAADTPDDPFFVECAQRFGLSRQLQSAGDLGDRMASCLQQLSRSRTVLLIGTDCPVWSVAAFAAAARALEEGAHLVFTPAEDGGYVLVGVRRGAPVPIPAFQGIAWGSDQVMAQSRARLAALGWQCGREWRELPALWDIDTPQDYLRACGEGLLVDDTLQNKNG